MFSSNDAIASSIEIAVLGVLNFFVILLANSKLGIQIDKIFYKDYVNRLSRLQAEDLIGFYFRDIAFEMNWVIDELCEKRLPEINLEKNDDCRFDRLFITIERNFEVSRKKVFKRYSGFEMRGGRDFVELFEWLNKGVAIKVIYSISRHVNERIRGGSGGGFVDKEIQSLKECISAKMTEANRYGEEYARLRLLWFYNGWGFRVFVYPFKMMKFFFGVKRKRFFDNHGCGGKYV